MGDIVFAQLPDAGTPVSPGSECGALESVKAASELYSPVSGEVTESNGAVEDKPGLVNKSAEADGWLFKVALSQKEAEIGKLMTREKYEAFLKSQEDDSS